MKKKLLVLIEDDFEIMGNGLGNVADLQYLHALFLMNIAEELGIKLTFTVEVVQQLNFNKYKHLNPNIRVQKKLWDEVVCMMAERRFDVQLHLHPQWLNAEYKDGNFHLSDNWNIGLYKPSEQKQLITESIDYLNFLLKPILPDYKIIAFKAGGWGLQPSESLLQELAQAGIRIVMGVRDGLKIPSGSVDYTKLEEKYLPYHPSTTKITELASERNELVIIPLQPYAPGPIALLKLACGLTINKIRCRNNQHSYFEKSALNGTRAQSLSTDKKIFKLSTHPYYTHLKIGNQPFSYLKASFDSVIKRMRLYDIERIPILIETHTKQYHNHYDDIKRFLVYLTEHYETELEFGDMTSYLKEIDENYKLVKVKPENIHQRVSIS